MYMHELSPFYFVLVTEFTKSLATLQYDFTLEDVHVLLDYSTLYQIKKLPTIDKS